MKSSTEACFAWCHASFVAVHESACGTPRRFGVIVPIRSLLEAQRTYREHRERTDPAHLTHKRHERDWNSAAQQSPAVLRCAILSVGSTGSTGSETARVHHAARPHPSA